MMLSAVKCERGCYFEALKLKVTVVSKDLIAGYVNYLAIYEV
jgi:hypothetical protein